MLVILVAASPSPGATASSPLLALARLTCPEITAVVVSALPVTVALVGPLAVALKLRLALAAGA
jgi:hypothetical protein